MENKKRNPDWILYYAGSGISVCVIRRSDGIGICVSTIFTIHFHWRFRVSHNACRRLIFRTIWHMTARSATKNTTEKLRNMPECSIFVFRRNGRNLDGRSLAICISLFCTEIRIPFNFIFSAYEWSIWVRQTHRLRLECDNLAFDNFWRTHEASAPSTLWSAWL